MFVLPSLAIYSPPIGICMCVKICHFFLLAFLIWHKCAYLFSIFHCLYVLWLFCLLRADRSVSAIAMKFTQSCILKHCTNTKEFNRKLTHTQIHLVNWTYNEYHPQRADLYQCFHPYACHNRPYPKPTSAVHIHLNFNKCG